VIYLVSDLFGNAALFERVKKETGFGDKDIMFILGNSIDYGEDSVDLIEQLSYAENIWTIAGKHEIIAREMLSGFEKMLKDGGKPGTEYINKMKKWIADGGDATFESFRGLDSDMKEGVLDYLNDMPTSETVSVGDKNYLLVSEESTYNPEEFPEEDLEGYITVIGHPKDASAGIVVGKDRICLGSCGERGSSVSVLRLDDMKGFLVK
jgi:serine/threonine protein phosphatase 1